jgi:hypothetical protein
MGTNLARSARYLLEHTRRGQTVLLERYGEERVAVVDGVYYRLLQAVAGYHARPDV